MSPTFKELTIEGRDKGDRPAMIIQGEKIEVAQKKSHCGAPRLRKGGGPACSA